VAISHFQEIALRFSEWEYKGKSERKGTYIFLLFLDEKKQKSSD